MKIAGSTAIVTGGASGLGRATVEALQAEGAAVALFDFNADAGWKAASETGAFFCEVDVSDLASVEAGFQKVHAELGQERVLVNCAGTGIGMKTVARSKNGEIRTHPMDQFRRVISINVFGTFHCIMQAAAGMITLDPLADGERGVIVNTASVAAQDGQAGQVAYAASKAAISGMTLPVARDLMDEGVRINTILPGIFDTPLMHTVKEDIVKRLAASVPFPRRFGSPKEFASLTLEICRNPYINGESIRLDGAIRMAPR